MHEPFLRRCLELAAQGRGLVGNGALVGAVLVRDGKIIAEGYHVGYGQVHAERHLLEQFTDPVQPDDILYTNLEPCCHHGKTLPCTDIILERGIKHIVYGMQDPDQRVAGKGNEILRSKGVDVFGPVSLSLCERLNRGFVSVRTKQRPFITLKQAITRDGKIANDDGSPMRITSEEQDIWSHTYLRAEHDAILVGVNTIVTDNPRLDTRLDALKRDLHPWRIILDRTLRIPPDARVITDDHRHHTIIVHAPIVDHDMELSLSQIQEKGVRLLEVPVNDDVFEWNALWQALTATSSTYAGMTSLLVEGGRRTAQTFRQSLMFDEDVCLVGSSQM